MPDHQRSISNPYRPYRLRIKDIRDETADVRSLRLEFIESEQAHHFSGWAPGQFGEFTVFGVGECVFAMTNCYRKTQDYPINGPLIECTFREIGKVTHALRQLKIGQEIGYRGPYGNSFPIEEWKGTDLVFLGGGIGMAALRAALLAVLSQRADYGQVILLNGARSVSDLVYTSDMIQWQTDNIRVVRTVDPGGETDDWEGQVGLLPQVFEQLNLSPTKRIVIACGPPVMLQYPFQSLTKLKFQPQQVITTLENKMKCGFGHCGRCNVGQFYVCRDGPILTWEQLQGLPQDF